MIHLTALVIIYLMKILLFEEIKKIENFDQISPEKKKKPSF